jgi:hypothetical protein
VAAAATAEVEQPLARPEAEPLVADGQHGRPDRASSITSRYCWAVASAVTRQL